MGLMSDEQPDQSFQSFLDSLPNDDATRRAKAVATRYVQGFHAADVRRIGVHGLIKANEGEEQIDGDKSFRVLGGYQTVTHAISDAAKNNGASIELNKIVKEIHWNDASVNVLCTAGERDETFRASTAVITLPLGVLQAGAVRFVPDLPADKVKAIHGLAMGHATRITLHFRERFWEKLDLPGTAEHEDLSQLGFIHYPDATIPTWWSLLPVRAAVLTGWTGGPRAEQFIGRDRDYVVSQALASLSEILKLSERELAGLLVSAATHDWATDVFSRGAYAYLPKGGVEAQKDLARPVGDRLFFAGEATAERHIGTVHGAVESGCRAALEVLATR
jgi:monoamine oxidase